MPIKLTATTEMGGEKKRKKKKSGAGGGQEKVKKSPKESTEQVKTRIINFFLSYSCQSPFFH